MLNKTTKGKLENQSLARRLQKLKPIMVTTPKDQQIHPKFHSQPTHQTTKVSPRKENSENIPSTMHLKTRLRPLNLLGLIEREQSVVFQRPANLGEIVEDKTISKLRGRRNTKQTLSSTIDVDIFEFSGIQAQTSFEDQPLEINQLQCIVMGNIFGSLLNEQKIEYFD